MSGSPALRRLDGLRRHLLQPPSPPTPRLESPLDPAGASGGERRTAAVIGLGWMGMLYDLANRGAGDGRTATGEGAAYKVSDHDRPLPSVDVGFQFQHHSAHLPDASPFPNSYAEALADRLDLDLVAAADRDEKRLQVFQQRYGVRAEHTYTDAAEMLRTERPEVVAIACAGPLRALHCALALGHPLSLRLASRALLCWPCALC